VPGEIGSHHQMGCNYGETGKTWSVPVFPFVRAGMVAHAGEYRWSSYRANALGETDELLVEHPQFSRLGEDDIERRRNYRTLFAAHMDLSLIEEITTATRGNYALGDSRFAQDIEQALGRRVLKGQSGRPTRTK
jgi:putative transposase